MKGARVLQFVGVLSWMGLALNAQGAKLKLKPQWMASSPVKQLPNASYLYDTRKTKITHGGELDFVPAMVMDDGYVESYRTKMDQFEQYRNQGLLDPLLEKGPRSIQEYHKWQADFAQGMAMSNAEYQVNENLKKAEKNSKEIRTFRAVEKSVGKTVDIVTKPTATVTLDKENKYKFGTKTNIPGFKGQVWATTPIVNGTVDLHLAPGFNLDPKSLAKGAPIREGSVGERISVNMNRDLPYEFKSGVSYGVSSTTLTSQVTRPLFVPNLEGKVSHVRKMNNTKEPENVGEVNYKLSF